jgi:malonyl-CoA/methylmalonyl-CoA synthetase
LKQAELDYYLRDLGSTECLVHPDLTNQWRWPGHVKLVPIPALKPDDQGADNCDLQLQLDQPSLIIYTSGTTGQPKGVVHTHRSVLAQINSLSEAWRWLAVDRIPACLPMYHIHGVVNVFLCALANGALIKYSYPFDARRFWDELKTNDLTLFMGVPTMYRKLLDSWTELPEHRQRELRNWLNGPDGIRMWVSGSAAMPASLMKTFEKIVFGHMDEIQADESNGQFVTVDHQAHKKTRILERYGMTETGMVLSNPYDGPKIPSTVGRPLPGVDAKLMMTPDMMNAHAAKVGVRIYDAKKDSYADEYWGEVGNHTGIAGELLVRGDTVFNRYWNRRHITKESFVEIHGNLWFRTGDIAKRIQLSNSTGSVYKILGRASADIIKSGGYKLSALEIERVLFECDFIRDVSVVGLPDDKWGEIVCAVAVLKTETTEASLREWSKERMVSYKVPRRFLITREIPKNAMGKVNKKDLRQWIMKQL